MIWQDLVFLVGSVFSIVFLAPTLTDRTARVPLGTSLPSAALGVVYGASFYSMGMAFSASGSFVTGILWAAIAALRSPSVTLGLFDRVPAFETLRSD
ncbi:hypothetical protein M0R88_12070 [Halorussus gelatinilyticus]|uniref:Uncharacterized protein n=1 Tax=Halorussus gelatinilyticus TaxID=2937524 RepID=A0A8U0IGS0_9EURY|nr:hypothetical protein [Halorussus gelatinilyticus]UPV99258.1 hypothetical protein M0R88_12070 [Halorussus gelatinilyticus]